MSIEKPYRIYILIDPRDEQIKYVGKTSNERVSDRLCSHLWEASKSGKKNIRVAWLRSLLDKGLKPKWEIIKDDLSLSEANEAEIYYIAHYKALGLDLKNGQPGGDGNPKGFKFKKRYVPPKGKTPLQLKPYYGAAKGSKRTIEQCLAMSILRTGKQTNTNKPIFARNLTTKDISSFRGASQASLELNIPVSSISRCCNNVDMEKSHGYSFWFQQNSEPIIKLTGQGIKTKIIKFNKQETIIYNSYVEAAKDNNISRQTIYRAIKNNKIINGYTWSFNED